MQQFNSSAFRAGIRGFGWKASEAFSPGAMRQRSPDNKRRAMLEAAIRRIRLAKEANGPAPGGDL